MATKHFIQSAIEASHSYEDNELEARSYVGRAMYGKQCLGVELPKGMEIGQFVAAMLEFSETKQDNEDLITAFENMRQDSMGLGTIVYFPRIPYVENANDNG
jgi:hypothetical protein